MSSNGMPIFKDGDFAKVIAEKAEVVAKCFFDENKASGVNKNTQIRKFYDELVRLQQQANDAGIKKVLPSIYMVASKCAYANGKKLVGSQFYNFIKGNVMAVENMEDMKNCILFMEAVLCYYRMLNPNEN